MDNVQRIKVLHIDDDTLFLQLFRNTYGNEFDVISLACTDDIAAAIAREKPDALVLDYEIPGKNGLEVLKEVKDRWPRMPVLFYTGQGSEEIARQAFTEGAADYFVKKSHDFVQKEKLVNSLRKAVEKNAVEVELEEKQAMLEGIIEHNPYSIIIYDNNGIALRTNRAHTKLYGVSPSREEGLVFDDTFNIPEDVKKSMIQQWVAIRDTHRIFEDETALQNAELKKIIPLWEKGEIHKLPTIWYRPPFDIEGTPIRQKCVDSTVFSVFDSIGKIKYYVQMHEDVTNRIETEEELKKAHDELAEAYQNVERKVTERTAELAEMNTRLQKEIDEGVRLRAEVESRNRELEDFAYMVSHELKNNLLSIQYMMMRNKPEPQDSDMESLNRSLIENTSQLQRFVERLLRLARAGKTIAGKRKVSLDRIAEKVFSTMMASDKEAELRIEQSFPQVLCDPSAFEQVFSNLISNAISHRKPGIRPVIDLRYKLRDSLIEITVSDNGSGIDPATLPKLFDVTFTTNDRERFGFGLAIVKKLVEAHGGSVRAESGGSGCGAVFIITIPHSSDDAAPA